MAAALGAALLVGLAAGFALRPGKIEPEVPQALPVQAAQADQTVSAIPEVRLQATNGHCTAWLQSQFSFQLGSAELEKLQLAQAQCTADIERMRKDAKGCERM